MMEVSDSPYSDNPSATSCTTALKYMKNILRSVVMSEMAFSTFQEFNDKKPTGSDDENKSKENLASSLRSLLDEELATGEVLFTNAFCKEQLVINLAKVEGLTPHEQWRFLKTNVNGDNKEHRRDMRARRMQKKIVVLNDIRYV